MNPVSSNPVTNIQYPAGTVPELNSASDQNDRLPLPPPDYPAGKPRDILGSTAQFRIRTLNAPKQPTVLLAATVWWPLSARMAIRLLRYGCRVTAVCPLGHMLRHVEGIDKIYWYGGLRSLSSLESAIRNAKPDIVIPCDDRVVWQLHELYAKEPDLRPLIEASLGAPSEFEIVSRRDLFLNAAQQLGIRIPETRTVHCDTDIDDWFKGAASSAVLKLDGTWGGQGVKIVHSIEAARQAYKALLQPVTLAATVKRLLVNRDALALWGWRRNAEPLITVQQFVPGRPANSMLACWKGELLGAVAVEVITSQGATGAALVVRILENDEIIRAGRLLARRFKLSGFYGLDFMIDPASGKSYLIEMNPRCTQLGHLPIEGQGDLAGALCAKLKGAPCISDETPVKDGIVAFFPQTISWNPHSPYVRTAYHDVPWEQPRLVRELMRVTWPERQWISRLYHRFRSKRLAGDTEFTTVANRHYLTDDLESKTDGLSVYCDRSAK